MSPSNGFVKRIGAGSAGSTDTYVYDKIVSSKGTYGHTAQASTTVDYAGVIATFRLQTLAGASLGSEAESE